MALSDHPDKSFRLNPLHILGYISECVLSCYFSYLTVIVKVGNKEVICVLKEIRRDRRHRLGGVNHRDIELGPFFREEVVDAI